MSSKFKSQAAGVQGTPDVCISKIFEGDIPPYMPGLTCIYQYSVSNFYGPTYWRCDGIERLINDEPSKEFPQIYVPNNIGGMTQIIINPPDLNGIRRTFLQVVGGSSMPTVLFDGEADFGGTAEQLKAGIRFVVQDYTFDDFFASVRVWIAPTSL